MHCIVLCVHLFHVPIVARSTEGSLNDGWGVGE